MFSEETKHVIQHIGIKNVEALVIAKQLFEEYVNDFESAYGEDHPCKEDYFRWFDSKSKNI